MLIPLRHENMEGRRWPVVTFALIALNVVVFLGTHWTIEAQEPERLECGCTSSCLPQLTLI